MTTEQTAQQMVEDATLAVFAEATNAATRLKAAFIRSRIEQLASQEKLCASERAELDYLHALIKAANAERMYLAAAAEAAAEPSAVSPEAPNAR
jgi:hypothetical protein